MKILVVIPAYNEAQNIVSVVEEVKRVVPQYDFAVVNDGSRDETAKLCREHGYPLLDLLANLGLTGAVQTGMRYALENGYDAVVQIDGDGQHDPRYVPEMAALMEAKGLDLVIGSRFLEGKRTKTMRHFGNGLLNRAIQLTTGKRITDATSGMRLYGKRILKTMATDMDFSPEPDTVAYLIRRGAKVEEYPVVMRERAAGQSYLSPWRSIRYMGHMLACILLIQWFRKRGNL